MQPVNETRTSIKDKTIPGNVKSIGSYAFAGCSNYKLIIEEGVKSIGAHAFGETSSLRYVELPESLTFIGEKAFCPWYRDPSDITLKVHRNSYAEEYAKQNGYKIEYFE